MSASGHSFTSAIVFFGSVLFLLISCYKDMKNVSLGSLLIVWSLSIALSAYSKRKRWCPNFQDHGPDWCTLMHAKHSLAFFFFFFDVCVLFRRWWGMAGQLHRDGSTLCQEKQNRLNSTLHNPPPSQSSSFVPHENSCFLLFCSLSQLALNRPSRFTFFLLVSLKFFASCPQRGCPGRTEIKLDEERSILMQLKSQKLSTTGTLELVTEQTIFEYEMQL